MNNPYPFFTVGHAVRQIDEFVALLDSQEITLLVDVRSVPRSLKNPQFNESSLPISLRNNGIEYLRMPELGGFRAKSKTVPPLTNAYWQHNSFHSYADYAMSEEFLRALNRLIELGRSQRTAIMCAELLWWRCHRRIIADYLLANGQEVYNIISPNNIESAQLTPSAIISTDGTLSYPSN